MSYLTIYGKKKIYIYAKYDILEVEFRLNAPNLTNYDLPECLRYRGRGRQGDRRRSVLKDKGMEHDAQEKPGAEADHAADQKDPEIFPTRFHYCSPSGALRPRPSFPFSHSCTWRKLTDRGPPKPEILSPCQGSLGWRTMAGEEDHPPLTRSRSNIPSKIIPISQCIEFLYLIICEIWLPKLGDVHG